MSQCAGCYKPQVEGYCLACRKALFDGARVPAVLDVEAPEMAGSARYREQTRRLSISGVQLKYSLKLEGNKLVFTDQLGQYILKPIPPAVSIEVPAQAPENEHLTMQIAARIFRLPTAANALIYFKDGSPAYLTRRFDVKPGGGKYQQEDMAQLSGRSRQANGEHFKYAGSYEEIGRLIQRYVAAPAPALENYFRLVLFNYLFSNGDAHLKNFSLIQSAMGDYILAPAYDLMCSVLHTPYESDLALDLYPGDMDSPFYSEFGYYGPDDFKELARRLGLLPVRTERIFKQLTGSREQVEEMIQHSLLQEDMKARYEAAYKERVGRIEED